MFPSHPPALREGEQCLILCGDSGLNQLFCEFVTSTSPQDELIQFQLKPFKSSCLQPEAASISLWELRSSFVAKQGNLYPGFTFSFSSLSESGLLLASSGKLTSSFIPRSLPSGKPMLVLPCSSWSPTLMDKSLALVSAEKTLLSVFFPIEERNIFSSLEASPHFSWVFCSMCSSAISFVSKRALPL
uniref:Uncharacterized protein MANES_09G142300 n=1 Tax=Rhizophora mucronata TaxID=61149 RepID=A0A2P2LI02_RHIMU